MRDTKPETTYEFLNNQVLVGMDFAEAEASTICVITSNGNTAELIAHMSRLNQRTEIIVSDGQTYITKENLIKAMDYLQDRPMNNLVHLTREQLTRQMPYWKDDIPEGYIREYLDPIARENCIYKVDPAMRGCRGHVSPYDPNPRKGRRYGK